MPSNKLSPEELAAAGRVMMAAHAWCPSEIIAHNDRMRWMAEYFLTHYVAPATAATTVEQSQPTRCFMDATYTCDFPGMCNKNGCAKPVLT